MDRETVARIYESLGNASSALLALKHSLKPVYKEVPHIFKKPLDEMSASDMMAIANSVCVISGAGRTENASQPR